MYILKIEVEKYDPWYSEHAEYDDALAEADEVLDAYDDRAVLLTLWYVDDVTGTLPIRVVEEDVKVTTTERRRVARCGGQST